MRLAAIYIEQHEYLFDEPQTINLGGKYLYSFRKDGEDVLVSRTVNKYFVDGFFDLVQLDSRVTQVSAIVGQNGAGKSTLLDIIRSRFIDNEYALPQSTTLFLAETDNNDAPAIMHSDFNRVFLVTSDNVANRQQVTGSVNGQMQTIYYSPHFDYKYNPNFDEVDSHDISFDRTLQIDLDLKGLETSNENGWNYPALQELLFKNSLRQIDFLYSPLVKSKHIFRDLFDLQDHHDPLLVFRETAEKDNWNTPSQFRSILSDIERQVEKERNGWVIIRDEEASQINIHKYFLKLHIISCILHLLRWQMEKYNTFLQEGYFPDDYSERLDTLSAIDMLLLFIEHSAIKIRNNNPEPIFNPQKFEELINRIWAAIDKIQIDDHITRSSIRVSPEDAVAILSLQREFLSSLNVYYQKHYSNKEEIFLKESDRLPEFISYMPFLRRMSSGENALLNFFSRLYNFLQVNLRTTKSFRAKSHYILLLDEADLSFHLIWKKRFVKAILKTLPYFFTELNHTPSIQIIFTTHDPITLSDMPNGNVIYLSRLNYNSSTRVLDFSSPDRPRKTFGANIAELIADSFFIDKTPVGDFATDKIREVIAWLNQKNNQLNADYYKQIISIIDEPIVQRKLAEMFDEKMQTNFQLQIVNDQIIQLKSLRRRLQS